MGYFALKFLVVAALLMGAAIAFPLGALHAAKNARRKHSRTPTAKDLTGAQIAGLLLHREGLGAIGVENGAEPLAERYAATAGKILLADDTARGRSVHATATAAFLVAKVALHADGDRDFARAHARGTPLALCVNLLPVTILLGFTLPGEGRVALLVGAPLLLSLIAGYTLLSLPVERRAARRALDLLKRHGLVGDRTECEALRTCLAKRAALVLAEPLRRCFWVNWAL